MPPVSTFKLMRIFWPEYAWGLGFLLITNALGAILPWCVKHAIEIIQSHASSTELWPFLALMAGLVIVMYAVRVLSRYFLIGVGRKIEQQLREQLLAHLLKLPQSFYDTQKTGELMSRLTNDLSTLRIFLGGSLMLLANVVFAYVLNLPFMWHLSPVLTIMAFVAYPLVVASMRPLSARVKKQTHQVQGVLSDLSAVIQENISGMSVIQSYAKEPQEAQRVADIAHNYLMANMGLVKTRTVMYILIGMVSGLSLLAVFTQGGREVILGTMTLSGFAAFMLYLERLAWPTISMGWVLASMQQGQAAIERVNELLQTPLTLTDEKAQRDISVFPKGPLQVKNLTFSYQNPYAKSDNPPEPVLRDIHFNILPGQTVAIVGPIGSGKTTLLNLLARVYSAPKNQILYGETPIEAIPLSLLRDHVSLMSQNPYLFSETLESNLGFAQETPELSKIRPVAELAQIDHEIMAFPQQYQTKLGERGVTLSGGQRQRSTLTRTLLTTPDVLLLDDPFASVDSETEHAIIQGLKARRWLHNKTTLFTSHRFTWVQQADWILVLNSLGQLEAQGTHTELMLTSALYQALFEAGKIQSAQNEVLS